MTVPVLGEASVLGVGDPRVARAQAGGDPHSSSVAPGADFLGTGMLVPRLSRLGLAGRGGCRMYQVSSCAQWQPCVLQSGEQGALLLQSSLGGLFLQHQFCSGG